VCPAPVRTLGCAATRRSPALTDLRVDGSWVSPSSGTSSDAPQDAALARCRVTSHGLSLRLACGGGVSAGLLHFPAENAAGWRHEAHRIIEVVQMVRPVRCCCAVACTEYRGFESANARGCFGEAAKECRRLSALSCAGVGVLARAITSRSWWRPATPRCGTWLRMPGLRRWPGADRAGGDLPGAQIASQCAVVHQPDLACSVGDPGRLTRSQPGVSRPARSATGSAAGSPARCAACRPGPGGR
jgi:hypothetical protein